MRLSIPVCGLLLCVTSGARADHIYLTSGTVLEGKATRVGEKVIVEVESGTMTLPAGSVQRVVKAQTELEIVDARQAALAPNDVPGLLNLANYCRDHQLTAREHELLLKILELDTNHEEARARLGYVRSDTGAWITQDDQRRAQGLVKRDGRWLTPEQVLQLQKLEAEARSAQLANERAQVELDTQRAALAERRAETDRREQEERAALAAGANAQPFPNGSYYSPYGYRGSFVTGFGGYAPYGRPAYGNQWRHVGGSGHPPAGVASTPFSPMGPPGTSAPDPRTMMFNIPGWRDPRSYF